MNINNLKITYDINSSCPPFRTVVSHDCDVNTRTVEVCFCQGMIPLAISKDCTAKAIFVERETNILINDNVPCTITDSGSVLIPVDDLHRQGRFDMDIEVTIANPDGNKIIATPFPMWITVNASILNNAEISEESKGTVPELLKEAAEALAEAKDYENLDNLPAINGHELVGNKTGDSLGLQNKLTAGENITINANGEISASGGVTSYTELTDKPLIKYYMGNGVYSTAAFTGTLATGISAPIVISKSGTAPNNQFYISLDSTQVFLIKTTTSYDVDTDSYSPFFLALSANRLSHLPSFVSPKSGTDVSLLNLAGKNVGKQIQLLFWRDSNNDPHCAFRVYGASWQELGSGSQIVSAAVNQDGTITFTDSDGNTFTTTGSSVIGFSPTATVTQTQSGATVTITDKNGTTTANISNGNNYVLTAQDKSDIAAIVLSELPTTQGVLYGNTSD